MNLSARRISALEAKLSRARSCVEIVISGGLPGYGVDDFATLLPSETKLHRERDEDPDAFRERARKAAADASQQFLVFGGLPDDNYQEVTRD